jgi:hypothetical protein
MVLRQIMSLGMNKDAQSFKSKLKQSRCYS